MANMVNEITLHQVLPCVFKGMEDTERIRTSQIWEVPSFVFAKGCKICIQAESGCGKSSLLSFIFGNRSDYKGQILYDGADIRAFGISRWCDIRTRGVALLPQEMRLFPELSVRENILIKNRLTDFRSEAEIGAMLEELELERKADEPVGRLSIGQQQRVAIVRALCQPFDFLLADEPVSHLDERNNAAVAGMIVRETRSRGASVIATSVGNKIALSEYELMRL